MKSVLLVLLGAVSLSACAQQPAPAPATAAPAKQAAAKPGTPDERATAAIRTLNAGIKIDSIGPAPLPGFREAIVAGQVIYVSDDGRYLLQGSLYDIDGKRDLSQASMSKVRRELLATVPASDRIIFAPANPVHTVSVFTDIECGYCRKLHNDIAEYNRQGIAVEYLAFPRMGPASKDFADMISVWCAADRRKALTDAKNGKRVPPKTCTSPVAIQYDIGQRAGLTGTPMVIAADGTMLPGYMPPAEMRQMLDRIVAESPSRAPTASAGGH